MHEHGGEEDLVGDVGLHLHHLPPRVDGQSPVLEPVRELVGKRARRGFFSDDVRHKIAGHHLDIMR